MLVLLYVCYRKNSNGYRTSFSVLLVMNCCKWKYFFRLRLICLSFIKMLLYHCKLFLFPVFVITPAIGFIG